MTHPAMPWPRGTTIRAWGFSSPPAPRAITSSRFPSALVRKSEPVSAVITRRATSSIAASSSLKSVMALIKALTSTSPL